MLSRLISRPLRFLPLLNFVSSQQQQTFSKPICSGSRFPNFANACYPGGSAFSLYSTKGSNGKFGDDDVPISNDLWKFSAETDDSVESLFGEDTGSCEGHHDQDTRGEDGIADSFSRTSEVVRNGNSNNLGGEGENFGDGNEVWATAEGYEPWHFVGDAAEDEDNIFGDELKGRETGITVTGDNVGKEDENSEEREKLETEEKALAAVLKGPNRAFGDLIAASGITDEMLDSLISLKDLDGIQGLPPLSELEEKRYEKNARKTSRADIERQKQEEVAKARVRQVDDKGRAYGTGRRKCSVARVWIQPGGGKFVVNDKEFDVYFPMLDHRATLLRPFSETKTLGMWDVDCTVKGGGTSGQVGAIRLGISRALQCWEPGFRPPLKAAGFLTRDSRVVERKKPGKAKARKSFQWVKR